MKDPSPVTLEFRAAFVLFCYRTAVGNYENVSLKNPEGSSVQLRVLYSYRVMRAGVRGLMWNRCASTYTSIRFTLREKWFLIVHRQG